ncbi:MAG: PIN domain-containing protein [Thermoguttaceae bacterium]|jgi:predicted nucleic acid-binding protein
MSPVFLDTSGLIAVINVDDHWHTRAEAVWLALVGSPVTLLTTSLVLIEIGDGLARIGTRQLARQLRASLLSSPRVEVLQTTADDEARAWDLYGRRADKEWGVTDCVSIVMAGDRRIEDVFGMDHHFEQAGFKLLLK